MSPEERRTICHRRFLTETTKSAVAAALPVAFTTAKPAVGQSQSKQVREPAKGPLRVHPKNPRYFTDGSGRAVFLTGSHTWANLQDSGVFPLRPFDWSGYLEFLQSHDHSFMRLWNWEQSAWAPWTPSKILYAPSVYLRTGPGIAKDGSSRFDLRQFNPEYFNRMRKRIIEAFMSR